MQLIVGSYYCSHTDNQQPTCHYLTSHYPSGTMEYCNNLLFSRFPGRCQFFLEGFRVSQKQSFSPFACLKRMIVHKYMINAELYLTSVISYIMIFALNSVHFMSPICLFRLMIVICCESIYFGF